jgi:serine/threonine protein kinase
VKKLFEFTNQRYQVLGLEECPGGALLQVLRKKKRLSQAEARFYAAGILLGLEQLHCNGILFRE